MPFQFGHWEGALVVASDGFWNNAPTQRIREIVLGNTPLAQIPEKRIDLVRLRSRALQEMYQWRWRA